MFSFEAAASRKLPSTPRSISVVGSLFAHAVFFAWLLSPPLPSYSGSAYDLAIRPQETHLVWYSFKRKLPDVSPATRRAQNQPLRADSLDKQSILSSPRNAPKTAQVVIHPAPEMKPQPLTPLPNMIALAAPPPPQRQFVAPQPAKPTEHPVQIRQIAPAPVIEARVETPNLPKLPSPARPFLPPPEHQPKLTRAVKTADAPELRPAASGSPNAMAKVFDQGSRMLAFRPQPRRSVTASIGNLPDAPDLGGTSTSANIAVVGLNAIDNLKVPLPESAHRGQLAAGPKLNPNGALSAGNSSGILAPDLTIRGGDKEAAQQMLARALTPGSSVPLSAPRGNVQEVARSTTREALPDAPARGEGIRVSGAPDPRFLGRQVFSVALQSPNLTSHFGSWLMWYADREALPYRPVISAPQPLHEVDPKYIATAVEERVEGTVRLAFVIGRDGRVYGVQTVKGLDDRLDRSASEALGKWRFSPAFREGQPIEVDALVEIPFHLTPKIEN